MTKQQEYIKKKALLLNDSEICDDNKKLFKEFLEGLEYKLKRKNRLKELDNSCYKTLCSYPAYIRNVNLWFENKAWINLTKADIKKVYDDLEEGKLKGTSGKIITWKEDYYNKIFRSKPFELAGKKDLAVEVMEHYSSLDNSEVRFFDEEIFYKIVNATKTIEQRLLCWLAWDFGENIFTLLQLQKKDFQKRIDNETKEQEYLLVFPRDKIKRSRTARSETTLYKESVGLIDSVLPNLKNDDRLFNFEHRNALKFLKQIREKINATTQQGQPVTWKDFRSSMACHLLNKGWTTDEIKARLGHKPSSKVLDKYVNYFALNKKTGKNKINQGKITDLQNELEDMKQREKLIKNNIGLLSEIILSVAKNKNIVLPNKSELKSLQEIKELLQ